MLLLLLFIKLIIIHCFLMQQFPLKTHLTGLPEAQCEYTDPRTELCAGAVTVVSNSLLMATFIVMGTLLAML